jgi:hypothetical protein
MTVNEEAERIAKADASRERHTTCHEAGREHEQI